MRHIESRASAGPLLAEGAALPPKPAAPGYAPAARRTPERAWVERLAALAPRSDALSWLHLTWEVGDPWEPLNRWVIWQMTPLRTLDEAWVKELLGPAPRATGHYCADYWCACRRKRHKWVGGQAGLIDQRQWELGQEARALPRRWWVVQGSSGGHLVQMSSAQQRIARLRGLPADMPFIGDLPMADPDERTWAMIAARDRYRVFESMAVAGESFGRFLSTESKRDAELAATLLGDWLELQLAKTWDDPTVSGPLRRFLASERGVMADVKDTTDYETEDASFHAEAVAEYSD